MVITLRDPADSLQASPRSSVQGFGKDQGETSSRRYSVAVRLTEATSLGEFVRVLQSIKTGPAHS
jgi:hypothetical protein